MSGADIRTIPCTVCKGKGCVVCAVLAWPGIWPTDKPLPRRSLDTPIPPVFTSAVRRTV